MRKIIFLAMLTLLVAGVAQASLVGYWKMDDGTGTVAKDSSGGGRDGALTGGPTWATGQFAGAVQLTGSSSQYVDLPIGPLIQTLTGDSTFAIWTNWLGSDGGWTRIWDFGNSSATGYMFLTCNQGSATGNVRFAITTTSNGNEQITNDTAVLPTGWHHVVVTFEHATSTVKLWLDGAVRGTSTATTLTPSSLGNTSANFLGKSQWADPYYTGRMDDFRIYDTALTQADIEKIMTGYAPIYGIATMPAPADLATDIIREINLGWNAGPFATSYDVYLGTSFDDVNNATKANSKGTLVSAGQTAVTYDPPSRLEFGTTYYWRVDAVDAATTYKGDTWSFTTEPVAYKMTGITATASSVSSATNTPAINTVNDSDMTGDLAGVYNKGMWLSSSKSTLPAWIQFNFDDLYKLDEMKVWNHNSPYESALGFGAKDTVVEYSTDGTTWIKLGDFEFAQATGEEAQAANAIIAFNGVAAKAVKITINNTWLSTVQTGLSEVRFYYLPVAAREPSPATGTTAIDPTTVALSWRAGREAATHNVYLGTDANALTLAGSPTTASFTPANAMVGTKYYWRVDEVNMTAAPTTWASPVWNFSTADYVVVDDMETYNDGTNSVFNIWIDGYNTSDNGAVVGYNSPANGTFNDTAIIHGGKQSMPFAYGDRNITTSEATRTFAPTQDWSRAGIKTLTVFFHGATANTASQLYVKVNGTKVTYPGDASILSALVWKQWNIDLSAFGNVKAVQTLTLGVTGSGKGTLYIDDIRLYNTAPIVPAPVDPGTSNLVASYAMEGDAKDSKGGYNGTANNVTFADSMLTSMGKAAVFNGTNAYIDLGATFGTGVVSKLSSCTLTAWVNYTGATGSQQRVFDFGTGTTSYMFLCTRGGSTPYRFAITTGGNASESGVTSAAGLSVGWHQMTAVLDGAAMTIALYVDGTLIGSAATTKLPKDLGATTQNWLGRSMWSADAYLTGSLDEFRVYNRALTTGEITYLAGDR